MAATVDEVYDDFLDNADYEEQSSVAKARKFVTAAKRLILLVPQTQSDQGSSVTQSVSQIENMMRHAQQFVRNNTTSSASMSAVRFLSAGEGFRR